jgi:hypothetical protein
MTSRRLFFSGSAETDGAAMSIGERIAWRHADVIS